MARYFHEHYKHGAWRHNKSLARQRQIQDSIDWDEPQPHKALAHIKTAIELKRPEKGRVIQAFHNPADNYSLADSYRAFTEALVAYTDQPRHYLGMYVHARSACGLNHAQMTEQINAWLAELSLASFSIFLDDVSNMDGSIQPCHLELQAQLYDALDPAMAADLRRSIRYKGMVRTRQGLVVYSANGTVRSGAQDTSSGQTTRRLDIFVRVCRSLGVRQVRAFVFGDDILAFLVGGPSNPAEFDAQHTLYGLKCRACYVPDLCQADFLACTFVPTVDGAYAMVPKPGRLLAKLFWTWRTIPPRRLASYLHQVAEAFLPRYAGCEFLEQWLRWHMRAPVDKLWDHAPPFLQPPTHTSPMLWPEFFARRYGLPPPPLELISELASIPIGTTAIIAHAWSQLVQEFDLADPGDR